MITSLILFNGLPALRALLSVCHDPSNIFTLCWILESPLFCYLAIAGSVWFTTTSKTEIIPAFANHLRYTRILILNTVITTWIRTPTHILVIICVCLAEPFHISLQILILEILNELWMRNLHIAHMLWAFGIYCLKSFIHFLR